RKVSAEVDLVHQQTQNQRYGSSHIGATAKDISNVVTDAASGVVDIFHGIDIAVADTWNNFWKVGKADGIGRLLEASTMKSRRGFAIQRLMNAMRQAHADGWFIVFDSLTLADDRLEAFYDNPNALRDYFRDIGRMV